MIQKPVRISICITKSSHFRILHYEFRRLQILFIAVLIGFGKANLPGLRLVQQVWSLKIALTF